MIKVGIVGYGNLGHAVERVLRASDQFELVAIFSNRSETGTVSFSKIENFIGKIELLFVCVGSQNNLESVSTKLIEYFSIIETYDNHARLGDHVQKMDTLAKSNKKIALCSFGWDPGLFSMMRGLFAALGFSPVSFWGKGTSQGHTQAIKNVDGVIDAVQFTVPNQKLLKNLKKGAVVRASKNLHRRLCYVVAGREARATIQKTIVSMPDYFEGYCTKVRFVSQARLDKLKNFSHQGEVATQNNVLNFSLHLSSNPDFTAKVVTTFARAYFAKKEKKAFGAYTIFDIPLSDILQKSKFDYL